MSLPFTFIRLDLKALEESQHSRLYLPPPQLSYNAWLAPITIMVTLYTSIREVFCLNLSPVITTVVSRIFSRYSM
jgi:hypothetical protein